MFNQRSTTTTHRLANGHRILVSWSAAVCSMPFFLPTTPHATSLLARRQRIGTF